jgi:hypothetical protein
MDKHGPLKVGVEAKPFLHFLQQRIFLCQVLELVFIGVDHLFCLYFAQHAHHIDRAMAEFVAQKSNE